MGARVGASGRDHLFCYFCFHCPPHHPKRDGVRLRGRVQSRKDVRSDGKVKALLACPIERDYAAGSRAETNASSVQY